MPTSVVEDGMRGDKENARKVFVADFLAPPPLCQLADFLKLCYADFSIPTFNTHMHLQIKTGKAIQYVGKHIITLQGNGTAAVVHLNLDKENQLLS